MSKKKSIILVVLAEALVYLLLLVGIPAIAKALICSTCNFRELMPTPLIVYLLPGLIGIFFIMVILKQKREVKDE
jgi:uncharacterized membrane protein